jgi:Holliday junction resolvase RusA-like endonuclease
MNSIRIELPKPPNALMPNVSAHWRVKANAVKQQRGDAKLASYIAVGVDKAAVDAAGFPWKDVTAQVTWMYSQERYRPDRDNVNACMKSAFDGIADAGVIANDRFLIPLPPILELVPAGKEGVGIVVERFDDGRCPMCKRSHMEAAR